MKKGFTLIELLVVVLIIGILSGIAVPSYTRSVRRAELMEGLTNGKIIYDAVVRYKSVNNELPNFDQIDIGLLGTEATPSPVFTDVNFTYTITSTSPQHLKIQNNKDDYYLQMMLPVVSSTGVSAPVYCCPATSWVCSNASKATNADGTCTEIK